MSLYIHEFHQESVCRESHFVIDQWLLQKSGYLLNSFSVFFNFILQFS